MNDVTKIDQALFPCLVTSSPEISELTSEPLFVLLSGYAGTGWTVRINDFDCWITAIVGQVMHEDCLIVYAPYEEGHDFKDQHERRTICLGSVRKFHVY